MEELPIELNVITLNCWGLLHLSKYRAERLTAIGRELAAAERGCVYGRMGVSTQARGTLCQWLIQLLNIATGNLDHEGGAMFTRPAVDLIDNPTSKPGSFGRWTSRVRGLPEFGGELPVAALAEETGEQQPSPVVIRNKRFPAEALSVEEAVDRMELVGHDFFLFCDADSGRPSVVYRRHAYDYGLLRLAT